MNTKALHLKLEAQNKGMAQVKSMPAPMRSLDDATREKLSKNLQLKGIGEVPEDEGTGFKNRSEFKKVQSQFQDLPIVSTFKKDEKKKWSKFGPSEAIVQLNTPSEDQLHSRTQKTSFRFVTKPKPVMEKMYTTNYSGKRLQSTLQKMPEFQNEQPEFDPDDFQGLEQVE